ncbi:hypothetical protein [Ehrlichia canis]|uniref:Uncharacterized protein n=1 Tax=Ehrlichia canis (strain Jake) TaxID=269484 RepID=A0ACA6AWI1_EHRCJ|nr:hypothetical protein [Ehrlichia canis]AAZ68797.1 hypothetical protein Ecaj_0766 [Ehrlichia canis str. Jake]AUO54473.1 hypothetical protein C1I72_00960 [Ehrlichia canis]UKC53871.1 hypothetical protein s20019040002_000916 [Ehrlichia canis]UKC54807.1 hypothetical protein s20026770001_000915 [Ehrlichia canis]UKC55743.1 hypothetical protein s21009500007_000915 [Ehrlichia canis]
MGNNDDHKIKCMECLFSLVDVFMCLIMSFAIFGILRMAHDRTEQRSENQNVEPVALRNRLRQLK